MNVPYITQGQNHGCFCSLPTQPNPTPSLCSFAHMPKQKLKKKQEKCMYNIESAQNVHAGGCHSNAEGFSSYSDIYIVI